MSVVWRTVVTVAGCATGARRDRTIRRTRTRHPPPTPKASRACQPDPPARRVLIAEDEALIRLDLNEMLEEEGYDVVGEAGDGATAVRLADELRPDLVILDVKMPVLDGIAAAEQIVPPGSRPWCC